VSMKNKESLDVDLVGTWRSVSTCLSNTPVFTASTVSTSVTVVITNVYNNLQAFSLVNSLGNSLGNRRIHYSSQVIYFTFLCIAFVEFHAGFVPSLGIHDGA